MSFQTLVVTPTGDIFQDLYNKFDNNANQSIDAMTLLVNTLTLTRSGGGTLTVNLPIVPNRIVTGMVASSVGFNLSITAGTYQINNASFSIGAGAFVIPAAHPTLNRIDILVADDTGVYVYLTGVAAVNPIPPAVASNQVLVTAINVPAASIPNLGNGFYLLPQGTLNGQTLRWNAGTMEWVTSDALLNVDSIVNITPSSNFNVAAGVAPNNAYINSNAGFNKFGIQLGAFAFSEINFDASGISIISNGVGAGPVVFDVEQGIQINAYTPAVTTDKLYNIGGVLYWSGDAICLAPCGGGGLPVGTVDFSTLRYDLGAGDWIENIHNIANDNKYNLTCSVLGFLSIGVANIATGILFSNSGGANTLQSNASAIMTSGSSANITHIPTVSTDGNNTIIGSKVVDINLHPDYKGLCTIVGSSNSSISHITAPTAGVGQCLILGSEASSINSELAFSGVVNTNIGVINDSYCCGVGWSFDSGVGNLSANYTQTSGVLFSEYGQVKSTHATSNRCVVIGGEVATVESGQTCGIYSSFGGDIKAYTAVGAIICQNSAILGGISNAIDPTGTANIQNCVVIGGSTNNLTGGAGNCTNSAIISSTGSDITPAGAGNRIVVIGCNAVSATKNNTTYVDGIDTQGSHTYSSIQHVTTNTYNVATGDHIIGCLNTSLFVTQTIYLPATPTEGDIYIIENPDGSAGGVGTITIDGNGNNVNGAATLVLNTAYVSKTVRYYAGTVNAWLVGM